MSLFYYYITRMSTCIGSILKYQIINQLDNGEVLTFIFTVLFLELCKIFWISKMITLIFFIYYFKKQ